MQLALPFNGGLEYEIEALLPPPPYEDLPRLPPFESEPVDVIEALPPEPEQLAAERWQIVGTWQGGRRYVPRRGRLASVWFRFGFDGDANLTVRYEGERKAQMTVGRWEITCAGLALTLSGSTIDGPFTFRDGVMCWAGEVLVRLTEQIC